MQIWITIEGEGMEGIGQQLVDLSEAFRTDATATPVTVEVVPARTPASMPATVAVVDPNPQRVPDPADEDTDGQPWNEKIHSGKKSKKASGQWTLKRGVNKELVAKTYAAHMAKVALATEPLARTGPIAQVGPAAAAAASVAAAGTPPVDPFAAPVAADPVAACLQLATDILGTSDDEVQRATISQGLNAALATQNLVGTAQLMEHPDCAPAVLEELVKLGRLHGLTC